VLFLPGLVNGVAYVSRRNMATFGIAVGAALISLLFDGFALLATIYFIKVVRSRLDTAKRKDPAPGFS